MYFSFKFWDFDVHVFFSLYFKFKQLELHCFYTCFRKQKLTNVTKNYNLYLVCTVVSWETG